MTKFRKTLFLTAALIMTLSLFTGCGSHSSDAVEKYLSEAQDDSKSLDDNLKLAWSPQDKDIEYYKKMTEGFQDYCDDHKYTALIADPSGSMQEQYSELENWTAMGADAIAVAPINAEHLRDITAKAQLEGIVVAGAFRKVPNADFNYTLDEYDLGYLIGKNALRWAEEKLGGRANVLLMLNDSDEFLKLRGDGIKAALAEAQGVRTAGQESVDSVPDAKVAANSALKKYIGVDMVVCISDEYAVGVLEVAEELDLDTDDFYIGGAGYTDEAVKVMNESGSCLRSSVNLFAYETGWELADMMAKAVVNGVEQDTSYFTPESYWQNVLLWN